MDGLDDLKAKYLTAVATVSDEAALEELRVAASVSAVMRAFSSSTCLACASASCASSAAMRSSLMRLS